jgi:nudix-type nucleoside diphosphatase (YffH/AdpP family)
MTAEMLGRRVLYAGFAKLVAARIRLPDGAVVEREVEDRGDAACVLPYDPVRRTALLVRLLRAPLLYRRLGAELTEAPAGMIDPGETAEQAIRREAMEEVGVELGALEPVATVWPSPGLSAERVSLFLAPCDATARSPGGGKPGEHEGITVLEVSLDALREEAGRGEIEDVKLLVLVQALRLRRPELFG